MIRPPLSTAVLQRQLRAMLLWALPLALAAVLFTSLVAKAIAQGMPSPAIGGPGAPASAPASLDGSVPASVMAHSCAACHGTNGQLGDEAFVPLAGMPVGQFVTTMIDFREGRRPSTLMGHVARGFSDADLQAMGEFFVAQPPLAFNGTVQGAQ